MVRGAKQAGVALKSLDNTAANTSATMLKLGAALAATVAFQKLVRDAGEFEGAMQRSIAIMGDVSDTMRNEMSREARRVGVELNLGAQTAAESYFYLASAGFTAAQSVKALGAVADFAKAGMFDMATATDLATDAQSALGLKAEDATENLQNLVRVTDVLVKANTLANATVEQFSTALTTEAGAALKTFGKDIEEGVAVLAAFADQGVKAQVAGSGLSRILRLMGRGAISAADEYKRLGIAVFDSQDNMRNLADIIQDLERALLPMADAERIAALEALGFQARVQGVILPLLGTSDAIKKYEKELRQVGGTTRDVAEKQMQAPFERLGRAAKTFGDAFLGAGNALLSGLVPAMETAAKGANVLADAVIGLTLALGVVGLGKAIALTVNGFKLLAATNLVQTFKILGPTVVGLRDAFALLNAALGPAGWIVLGVAAITTAFVLWRKRMREAREESEKARAEAEKWREINTEIFGVQLLERQVELLKERKAALEFAVGAGIAGDEAQKEILEILIKINDLEKEIVERRKAGGGPPPSLTGGISEEAAKDLAAMQLELDKLKELNAARGESALALELIRIKYEELATVAENQDKFKGEELARVNALTRAYYEQARAQAVIEHEQDQAKSAEQEAKQLQELLDNLAATVDQKERLLEANKKGKEAIEELRIQIAGENALRETGSEKARMLAEEEERLNIQLENQAEAARKAKEAAEVLPAIYEEAAKGIQRALAGGFQSVFDDGLDGFRDLADKILDVFTNLASEIAALLSAQALGLDDLIEKLERGEQLTRTQGLVGAGLAGVGIGASTGAIGGAIGGAAAGASIAGATGAVIGGVAGLVSGLFSQAEEARKAAKEMERAGKEFNRALEGMIKDIRRETSELDNLFQEWADLFQEFLVRFDLEQTNIFGQDFVNYFRDFEGSAQEWLEYINLFGRGLNLSGEALEAWINLLTLATESVLAIEEAQRRQAEDFETDLRAREFAASGDEINAMYVRLIAEQKKELDAAQALVDQGIITEEQYSRLAAVLKNELEQALKDALTAAQEAAREIEEFQNSLYQRGLVATGQRGAADEFALRRRHEDELRQAREKGFSIELLKEIQKLELDALRRNNLLKQQIEEIRKAAAEQVAAIDKQLDVLEDQLRTTREQLRESERIADSMRQTSDAIKDFSKGLLISEQFSPLSPEARLAEARTQFEDIAAAAQAGDVEAAADLPRAARELLEASRLVNASNIGYVQDFERVREVLDSVGMELGSQADLAEAQLVELKLQTEKLQEQIEVLRDQREAIINGANEQIATLTAQTAEANARAAEILEQIWLEILELRKIRSNIDDALVVITEPPFDPPTIRPDLAFINGGSGSGSATIDTEPVVDAIEDQTAVTSSGLAAVNRKLDKLAQSVDANAEEIRKLSTNVATRY
jgi:TP901 family phage tail tape measure protein